jgi:hypothetical protein
LNGTTSNDVTRTDDRKLTACISRETKHEQLQG